LFFKKLFNRDHAVHAKSQNVSVILILKKENQNTHGDKLYEVAWHHKTHRWSSPIGGGAPTRLGLALKFLTCDRTISWLGSAAPPTGLEPIFYLGFIFQMVVLQK